MSIHYLCEKKECQNPTIQNLNFCIFHFYDAPCRGALCKTNSKEWPLIYKYNDPTEKLWNLSQYI